MKKYYIILIAILLPFYGCEDENKDRKFVSFDELVIFDYLSQQADFSEWVKLIEVAGMKETFRLSTTPMTCFVARNKVLVSYVQEKYGVTIDQLDTETAQTLIKYHTLPNVTMSLSSFRNGKLADSTATGDYLACLLSMDDGGVYLNRESKVVDYDKEMVNGVIHTLDKVIDPVVYTLDGYLETDRERFSIMLAMLEACPDSTKALFSALQDDRVPSLKCRRTFFVVPDEVYEAAGINSLEQLRGTLGLQDAGDLEQYVRYHLLRRELYGKDMIERLEYPEVGPNKNTKIVDDKGITMETMAENKLIVAKAGAMDVFFNEDVTDGSLTFNADNYNIPVKNGVVHELNGVLKMADPSSMTTILDPTDYINVERLSTYRGQLTKNLTLQTKKELAPYIKWESSPDDKSDAVGYLVFRVSMNLATNFESRGLLYGDGLYISPGPVGYVEYQTPPVPKGRYMVRPLFKTNKEAAGGRFLLSIDGEAVGSELNGYTPGGDVISLPEQGVVVFNETKPHTVRLTAGSRQGELIFDMIILQPVN